MNLVNPFIPVRILLGLWAGMVLYGGIARAQERQTLDTLHLFNAHADTVRLGFEDTLHISAKDKDAALYAYRWDINGQEDGEEEAMDFFFIGQRKNKITGSRYSIITRYNDTIPPNSDIYLYIDAKDTVCLDPFPEYKSDSNALWRWSVTALEWDSTEVLPFLGPQVCLTAKEYWLEQNIIISVFVQVENEWRLRHYYLYFSGKTGNSMRIPKNEDGNAYLFNVFHLDVDRIYCHPNDTFYLDASWEPDELPENAWNPRVLYWYSSALPEVGHGDHSIIFFQGTRDRDYLKVIRAYTIKDTYQHIFQTKSFFIYWGIDPDAEIESDSVWVFFPQYPYSDLGGRVDICLPSDAPLPSPQDTIQTFNLGPWNRELDYVEYAWFDGTKDIFGHDSVVGTDSAFAYLFGRMDSVSPYLYAGLLATRVAADSLWQDSCQCFVPCTDDACNRYDTVHIYLHRIPEHNTFFPRDTFLCAHLDLELNLSDTAEDYRCFWLDRDSIEMPYGHDTARFTIQGMRGTDGFGAGTDTREPRLFQLRLDHRLCGVSYFDTLRVTDIVKPHFELACHDTIICLNEPVELDSLSPLVHLPAYTFAWTDGEKGSVYTFTDSGDYVLQFFVNKDFSVCGYDTARDTVHVLWSDPAMTLITLPTDTGFCPKLSVTLDASVSCASTRYEWRSGAILDEEDYYNDFDSVLSTLPTRTFKEEGTYNISLIDTLNCRNVKEINITEDDCTPKLDIPNVFTPNGDGVNDVWRFRQLEQCVDVVIEVVDRWGQPVLRQKVATADGFEWNGTMHGKGRLLPDGPYFYMVSYRDVYGKRHVQSGSITILGTAE